MTIPVTVLLSTEDSRTPMRRLRTRAADMAAPGRGAARIGQAGSDCTAFMARMAAGDSEGLSTQGRLNQPFTAAGAARRTDDYAGTA